MGAAGAAGSLVPGGPEWGESHPLFRTHLTWRQFFQSGQDGQKLKARIKEFKSSSQQQDNQEQQEEEHAALRKPLLFYINLDRRKDRDLHMRQQFAREELRKHFAVMRFPAIDGQ